MPVLLTRRGNSPKRLLQLAPQQADERCFLFRSDVNGQLAIDKVNAARILVVGVAGLVLLGTVLLLKPDFKLQVCPGIIRC